MAAAAFLVGEHIIAGGQHPKAIAEANSAPWSLCVRATSATWPRLLPVAIPGDLYWGSISPSPIPPNFRAREIGNYSKLASLTDQTLARYCAVYLDGEYADFKQAFT